MDPHWLVHQIMLDPRLPQDAARELKAEIIRRTGFKGEIKRSLLYAPPKRMFIPIGQQADDALTRHMAQRSGDGG